MKKLTKSLISLFVIMMVATFVNTANAQQIKSFSVKDATLEECLKQIEKQTGLGYLFKGQEIKSIKGITYSAQNVNVSTVLKAILANTGYTYEINKGVILIFKAPNPAPKPATSANQQRNSSIRVTVVDEQTKEPIIGAVAFIKDLGSYATADLDGIAIFRNIPFGQVKLEVQMMGYEASASEFVLSADREMIIRLRQLSLELDEVTVVAKSSAAGTSTSSKIGRQAMDHLQATSLKDIMQLIPGQLMSGVSNMTSAERITIRTLNTSNANNAFGTAIMVDGVPISDNASLSDKAGISTTGVQVSI